MRTLLILLVLGFLGIHWTAPSAGPNKAEGWRQNYRGDWFIPPEESRYFLFGFAESYADSLWLRLIQNFDFCENRDVQDGRVAMYYYQQNANQSGRSTASNANEQAEVPLHLRTPSCKKGWAFQMLDRITDASPKFRIAYAVGGVGLSVMVDDREGATLLFEKAIKAYPNDWPILYRAAYHFLLENNDEQRAAELLGRAAEAGAPYWTAALAGRLYSKAGRTQLAKEVIGSMLERYPDGPQAEALRKRLAEIEGKP